MFTFNTEAKTEKTIREQRNDYRTKIEGMLVEQAAKDLKGGATREVVCHTVAVIVKGYNQGAKSEEVRTAVEQAIDDCLDRMEAPKAKTAATKKES